MLFFVISHEPKRLISQGMNPDYDNEDPYAIPPTFWESFCDDLKKSGLSLPRITLPLSLFFLGIILVDYSRPIAVKIVGSSNAGNLVSIDSMNAADETTNWKIIGGGVILLSLVLLHRLPNKD